MIPEEEIDWEIKQSILAEKFAKYAIIWSDLKKRHLRDEKLLDRIERRLRSLHKERYE